MSQAVSIPFPLPDSSSSSDASSVPIIPESAPLPPASVILSDLEKTVTELVLELLLIDREKRYSELLFARPDQKQSVRITAHYVMALLAYGFTPDEPELKHALTWFDRPFPRRQDDFVNANEMNRLIILLHLAPEKEAVQSRLRALIRQQANGYFDIQPGWQAFDSLWALEALVLARQKGVLSKSLFSSEELRQRLSEILAPHELKRDKDRSLALRLWFNLYGSLEESHLALVRDILDFANHNHHMWGMREFEWRMGMMQMKWFQALVEGRKLTYEMVRDDQHLEEEREDNYKFFRKVILSTCMVIEYLSPLTSRYPHIRQALTDGLLMWWNQIKGDHGIETLHELFPKGNDYEYLLVLTRMIRALRAYTGRPLRELDPVYMLRTLTDLKTNRSESREMRNLKQVLRNWMKVDIIGAVEQLKLGFSEANVVRVQPFIGNPLAGEDDAKTSLINNSLVIKYGPGEMISEERKHYEEVPAGIKDYFVRIPETVYTDPETGTSYVVMQDLKNYLTLYEVYEEISHRVDEVGDQLGTFLCRMHQGSTLTTHSAPASLLRETYLGKMLEYIDRLFNFVQETNTFHSAQTMEYVTQDVQQRLFDSLGKIIQYQTRLGGFPAACMHGDLHLRNIMVRGLENTEGKSNLGLNFKLIDLEFLRLDGDAAFDLGQLLVDIDLVAHEEEKMVVYHQMMKLGEAIQRCYEMMNTTRHDAGFATRVELAKARALLRIAKGKTKRGYRFSNTDQPQQAQQMVEQVMMHASAALGHLEQVVKIISSQCNSSD